MVTLDLLSRFELRILELIVDVDFKGASLFKSTHNLCSDKEGPERVHPLTLLHLFERFGGIHTTCMAELVPEGYG